METLPSPRRAVGTGRPHDTRTADVETSGEAYARRFEGAVGRWMLDVQARAVQGLLASAAPGALRVLEVGGGHGQLTEALLRAGHDVVVHGSRPACHARLRHNGERVARVTSGLWRLPFRDGAFDLVAGIRLLAHVDEWRALLAEMARVSRRLVLVDFPVRGRLHVLARTLFGAKRRIEGNTRPYFDYAAREVEETFAALGLRPVGCVRQFVLPMVLHRAGRSPGLSRAVEGAAAALGLDRTLGSPALLLVQRRAASDEP